MLVTDALQRRFRARTTTVEAVRGIDMTVHPGEIVGLLGPNGAGKTTMMRMLTTLLVPTGGEARSSATTFGPTRPAYGAAWAMSPRPAGSIPSRSRSQDRVTTHPRRRPAPGRA